MKAWLKGGVIALGIDIVLAILIIIPKSLCIMSRMQIIGSSELSVCFWLWIILQLFIPYLLLPIINLFGIISIIPYEGFLLYTWLILSGLATWFGIGALIGFIVGKIKGRKK